MTYDSWKLESPYNSDVEEMCECANCKKDIDSSDLVWSGSMDVCLECFIELEKLHAQIKELLKPVLELKQEQLKKKLNIQTVGKMLPEVQAFGWLKKELEKKGIKKERVRIPELTTHECDFVIELLTGLHTKIFKRPA